MGKRWINYVLGAVLLGFVVTNVAMVVSRSKGAGDRSAQEITMLAKMALAGSSVPGSPAEAYEAPLVAKLKEAARAPSATERARALRRQAIWCSLRHMDCAPGALDALDLIAAEDRRPAPPDEVAILREILCSEAISADRAQALTGRLTEIKLGFFDHLLRERLHRRAGNAALADSEMSAALRSSLVAMGAMLLFMGLLACGVLAWLTLLFLPARSRIPARIAEALRERSPMSPGEVSRQLAVVVTFFAASLAIPLAVRPLGLFGGEAPEARAGWTLLLEVGLLLIVIAAHRVFGSSAGLRLGFQRVPVGRALGVGALSYLLLWPVLLLVMLPLSALFDRLGLPTQSHPIVEQLQGADGSPAALLMWLVVAAVLAPLLEEAVFRGALHGAISGFLGGRAALLIVALVFAVIHPQIGLGLVGVLLVGTALSLVRIHEGSLWPGVVLHAINNGVALLLAMALLSG